MDRELLLLMARYEDEHWWWVARRRILDRLLSRISLPSCRPEILDMGCGAGGNFSMLSKHGSVFGAEPDATTRRFASERGVVPVECGLLPDAIPFEGRAFDLVALLDILEHVERDGDALAALHPRIKPGGWLLVTAPALGFLWSSHDVLHQHCRRYTRKHLVGLVRDAGFDVARATYFNTILFPVIACARMLQRIIRVKRTARLGVAPPWWPVNRILTVIFAAERSLLTRVSFPCGVSLLVLARKR
jgi:SAM-dependent methyltransferase